MSKICSFCKEKLPSLESCTCTMLRYLGDPVSRIPFGDVNAVGYHALAEAQMSIARY